MGRRHRKTRNKQRKIVIVLFVSLLLVMSVGYAAFNTNLNINVKGNVKQMNAAKFLKTKVVDSGDGLYADNYEDNRYVYKGASPNNYITFNNETWRIISVESDGTLKIMRVLSLKMTYDTKGNRNTGYCSKGLAPTNGCSVWAKNDNFIGGIYSGAVDKDSEMNTYLNTTYYNNLSDQARDLIETHEFHTGPIKDDSTNLAEQITSEKNIKWLGNVGMVSASDVIRANTNIQQCGSFQTTYDNGSICRTTNYMTPSAGWFWTINGYLDNTNIVISYFTSGVIGGASAYCTASYCGGNGTDVAPSIFLKANIKLSGNGTSTDPYIIDVIE